MEVFVVGGGGVRNLFDHLEQQEPRIERFYIMDNVDFVGWLVDNTPCSSGWYHLLGNSVSPFQNLFIFIPNHCFPFLIGSVASL